MDPYAWHSISQLSQYPESHLHMPKAQSWGQGKGKRNKGENTHSTRQVNSGDLDEAAENKSKMFRRSTEIPQLLQQKREPILPSLAGTCETRAGRSCVVWRCPVGWGFKSNPNTERIWVACTYVLVTCLKREESEGEGILISFLHRDLGLKIHHHHCHKLPLAPPLTLWMLCRNWVPLSLQGWTPFGVRSKFQHYTKFTLLRWLCKLKEGLSATVRKCWASKLTFKSLKFTYSNVFFQPFLFC